MRGYSKVIHWYLFSLICLAPVFQSLPLQAQTSVKPQTSQGTRIENSDLATSKEWLRLLYYQKRFFNNSYKSEISNPDFFISKTGKKDPLNELNESLQVFFDLNPKTLQPLVSQKDIHSINDDHPICRFPARFFLLNKMLGFNQLNKLSHCTKMNEFVNRLNGQSVSLIFSSYFINNPSSAFGHTFLKINKSDDYELDLLNYGINYAATADTRNGFLYAFKGLFGFFPGEFTAVPYYYKVREYNDYESRDLWEYQLNLKSEDILFLNLHIWELGKAWSWYYFLDKNCSYWAIKVLEAIRSDLDLVKYFKSAFVIPIETVKGVLKEKGLIKNIKFRASLREQLLTDLKKMDASQIKTIETIVDNLNSQKLTSEDLKKHTPQFLETTLLYYDYTNASKVLSQENLLLQKKQPLLQARSELPLTQKKEIPMDLTNAPHLSHPPKRLAMGYRQQELKNRDSYNGLSLRYKQGFHEVLDSHRGFNPHMALNYFDISLLMFNHKNKITGISKEAQFILDKFHLISVDAFIPVNRLESSFSWRVKAGIDSEQFLKTLEEKVAFISFDTGLSKAFFDKEQVLIYFLISNTLETNGRFENSARLGLAPLVGVKLTTSKDTNLIFETKPLWVMDFKNKAQFITQSSLQFQHYLPSLNLSISLDGSYLKSKDHQSYNLGTALSYYF